MSTDWFANDGLDTFGMSLNDLLEAEFPTIGSTLEPPGPTPVAYSPQLGDKVFYVDSHGTSVAYDSSAANESYDVGGSSNTPARLRLQTNNVWVIRKVNTATHPRGGPTTYMLEPLEGRKHSVVARHEDLLPVGALRNQALLAVVTDTNSAGLVVPAAGVVVERRHSLLVRAAWVEDWQRMYLVSNPAVGAEARIGESQLGHTV